MMFLMFLLRMKCPFKGTCRTLEHFTLRWKLFCIFSLTKPLPANIQNRAFSTKRNKTRLTPDNSRRYKQNTLNLFSAVTPVGIPPPLKQFLERSFWWFIALYALLGILWILFSDAVLSLLIKSPVPASGWQLGKSFTFLLVSTFFFIFIWRFFPNRHHTSSASPQDSSRKPAFKTIPPLIVFLIMGTSFFGIGITTYRQHQTIMAKQQYVALENLAKTRADNIALRLDSLRKNAQLYSKDSLLSQDFQKWLSAPPKKDTPESRQISDHFSLLRDIFGYKDITLLDSMATPIAGTTMDIKHLSKDKLKHLVTKAIRQHRIIFASLKNDKITADVHLSIIVPIYPSQNGLEDSKNAMAYVANLPANLFLNDVLTAPTPDLLDAKTHLISLTYWEKDLWPSLAERLKLIIVDQDSPREEILAPEIPAKDLNVPLEALTPKGIPMVAVAAPVQETDLVIMASIPQDSLYAPLKQMSISTLLFLVAIVAIGALIIGLWWQQKLASIRAQQYRSDLEQEKLQKKYDFLSQFANDVILIVGMDNTIIECNERTNAIYGIPREDILGTPLNSLSSNDNKPLDIGRILEKSTEDQGAVFETVHRHRNGHTFPVEISVRRGDMNGQPVYQCILRDISERKQYMDDLEKARDHYRLLLEKFPTPVWLADTTGKCNYFNAAWLDFTGKNIEYELGEGWLDGVHPDDAGTCLSTYKDALRRQDPFDMEYRLRHRDGTYRIIRDCGRPLHDSDGHFIGYIGACYDIDDIRAAEDVMRQAKLEVEALNLQLEGALRQARAATAEADRASRAKSDFLANMSHELRTPLNAILGFAEMMDKGIGGTIENLAYKEYIHHIYASGCHLLEIINDVLDLSRIESGRMQIIPESIDPEGIIREASRFLEPKIRKAVQNISINIAPDLPPIWGEPRYIKQILINLLSNASKFSPAGATLTVCAIRAQDPNMLDLSVEDPGVGMTAEQISMAVQPFAQLEHHMSKSHEGTGLGLSLVKSLAEIHHGWIRIDSSPGRGTIVHTFLPLLVVPSVGQ